MERDSKRYNRDYDARADVLELLKSDLKKVGFADLAASLTPSLDFGKAPATPIEQIIELARQLSGDKSKSSEKSEGYENKIAERFGGQKELELVVPTPSGIPSPEMKEAAN